MQALDPPFLQKMLDHKELPEATMSWEPGEPWGHGVVGRSQGWSVYSWGFDGYFSLQLGAVSYLFQAEWMDHIGEGRGGQ